jgi:hypothetical protein
MTLPTVPWTCPACGDKIRHEQDKPLPGVVYRCHVCRLELMFDPGTLKLVIAPVSNEDPDRPTR